MSLLINSKHRVSGVLTTAICSKQRSDISPNNPRNIYVRFTDNISYAAQRYHDGQNLRCPMIAIHMLEEQRSNELARPLDLVCWNGGNVRDICQEEENGHSDERDYARIAYGTDRIRALDFIQDIESVRPADECEVRFDESGGQCVGVRFTSLPDVVEIGKGV